MAATAQRSITVRGPADRSRRAATQSAILEGTRRLLEQGSPLASLSVERIVREAGVSRATFYLHFKGKQELIERLAEQQLVTWRVLGSEILDDPAFTREQVERTVDEAVDEWDRQRHVLGALVEVAEYDPAAKAAWGGLLEGMGADFGRVIAQRRPELSEERARSLGTVIVLMIERCCHQLLDVRAEGFDRAEVSAALAEAVWQIATP